MNELKIFENPEFGEIRTVEKDGEPWFVGKDVCSAFGDKNHNRSVGRIDEEDKDVIPIVDSMGRTQQITVVNESGLYALLFAMQPQKSNHDNGVSNAYPIEVNERIEKLHRFKRWVTHDILPSIRKHGLYATEDTVEAILNDPDTFIKLLQELKEEREKRKAVEAENQRQKPKVEYFDALVDRNTLTNFRVTAKEFHMGQKEFIRFLINRKFIYRDKKGRLLPYEPINGLFEVKECKGPNNKWSGIQTLVTPKGRETFRLMLSHR